MSESLENFSVAVVATDDGRFAYQVFLVCGEPRTLFTDDARYLTPDDAAKAGYEAAASMFDTPVRRPYASSTHRAITVGPTQHRAGAEQLRGLLEGMKQPGPDVGHHLAI